MPKSESINFLSRVIESVLRTLSEGPPSIEAEGLAQVADSLRRTIKSWRQTPPTATEREDVVRRVLSLRAEVRRGTGVVREEVAIRKWDPREEPVSEHPPSPNPREEPVSEHPRNPEDDRPTVPPPFDMEAFARDASAHEAEGAPSSAPATRRHPSSLSALDDPLDMEIAWSATSETAAANGSLRKPDDEPAPRSFSPSSIERALLGFVEDPEAPVVSERDMGDPTAYMLDRFSLGDYADALDVAELILIDDPANRLAAQCRNDCREALEADPLGNLGPLDAVPVAAARAAGGDGSAIDHRADFLLSLVDGKSSLDEIVKSCGMPRLDALRILQELVRRGVVEIG
jgi:hypothetical protein